MLTPPRFLFLADSGAEIGGGHVLRSLTLAEAICERGGACAFVAPPAVQAILARFGTGVVEALPAVDGAAASAVALAATWGADWIFLDHYRTGPADEALLRSAGRLGVLDDLGERARDCDLLLDPGYGRTAETYAPLTPAGCAVLAGPAYALVRPQFATARPAALERRAAGRMRRGLVSLGLTDVGGVTERVVRALLPHIGGVVLDVALGAQAQSLAPLRALAIQDPRIRVHVETLRMGELMAAADLAVGAGGSSTWERCCVGLPAVTLVLADNQRALAQAFDRDGISPAVEAEDLEAMVQAWLALAGDPEKRARLSTASAALCDGLGAGRVAEAMLAF